MALNRVAEIAENAKPLNSESGRPKNDNDSNQNHYPRGGENADYLTARIARDHPEILADMKAGKTKAGSDFTRSRLTGHCRHSPKLVRTDYTLINNRCDNAPLLC